MAMAVQDRSQASWSQFYQVLSGIQIKVIAATGVAADVLAVASKYFVWAQPPSKPLQTQGQTLKRTLDLEKPFSWHTVFYTTSKSVTIFPAGSRLTISFTDGKISKLLGYLPYIGTLIGISRIVRGAFEYQLFTNNSELMENLPQLSKHSVQWMGRGIVELVPVYGGLICLVADVALHFLCPPSTENS